jgi:hypothetical protein
MVRVGVWLMSGVLKRGRAFFFAGELAAEADCCGHGEVVLRMGRQGRRRIGVGVAGGGGGQGGVLGRLLPLTRLSSTAAAAGSFSWWGFVVAVAVLVSGGFARTR